MSPDEKASGQSAPRSPAEGSKSSPSSQAQRGPTAQRGDQAPPGTGRVESGSHSHSNPEDKPAKAQGKRQLTVPPGYKGEPSTSAYVGLKRSASVLMDLVDPSQNVVIHDMVLDPATNQAVGVAQEPLTTQEVASRQQKLASKAPAAE